MPDRPREPRDMTRPGAGLHWLLLDVYHEEWQHGYVSDARYAERVVQAVSLLNDAFDQIRKDSDGAIDAHAAVKINLPRPTPPGGA